jgi:hypothetical protein
MMGSKQRSFAPLINRSLEDLVPPDHFYRHLERTLDHAGRATVRARDQAVEKVLRKAHQQERIKSPLFMM